MQVEEDDDDFNLELRQETDLVPQFDRNNLGINPSIPQPEIQDGRRMPTLYEIMEDDDFLPELRQQNEVLIG